MTDLLADLMEARVAMVWRLPDGRLLRADDVAAPGAGGVLSGSFNPRHAGHAGLRQAAEKFLGQPVVYELSAINADKPPLDPGQLERRLQQFSDTPIAVTRAPTFGQKARLFPETTFVVGVDTAERILDPRFYGASAEARDVALESIAAAGCLFLVAGRLAAGRFCTLADLTVPPRFRGLFSELPAARFRCDVSSTQCRSRGSGRSV